MRKLLTKYGPLAEIERHEFSLHEPFVDFAARFSQHEGTVVLLSGGKQDCARHNYLAVDPWLTLQARDEQVTLKLDQEELIVKMDPFQAMEQILTYYHYEQSTAQTPASGLFGYLAYDLKDRLELLPTTAVDDLLLPHLLVYAPNFLVIHEVGQSQARLLVPRRQCEPPQSESIWKRFKALEQLPDPKMADEKANSSLYWHANFSHSEYLRAVQTIREYIENGHVYQVNLSQRFQIKAPKDGFGAFRELFEANPASFFAYINADDHQILSTSPERFLYRHGSYVETRPIKGTRPRGTSREEDHLMAEELQQSPKDEAELSMIVDLMRNDLGKVCQPGSIKVTEHKRLESYQNVHHLVSIVTGQLAAEKTSVNLITACFPGGSITGCPKVRSMEIIDELEPCRRHIYTGSIGYFGFNNCLDLSIAIRTATLLNERLIYSVGGGIVYDSDPEAEYQETIDKGRTLQKRFTRQDNANQNQECVWLNGRLVPKNKATVSPLQPGFQYGAGLFETILSIQGSPYFLKEHLQRLNSAWQTLFKTNAPATDWPEVIHCTLKANKLLDQTAWVKILVAKGNRSCPPFDNTLMVQVGPYTHRLLRIQKPGLRLAIYPEPRQSPLAGFKTMNYLYCLKAGEWAQEKGCDEALILNPDGSIAETNSANVILLFGREAFSPHSQHVLPGVTQARIAQLLQEQGFSLRNEVLFPKDCFQANAVFLTNSLIGVVGAIALNGQTLKKNLSLACKLRSLLYSPDKY